MEHSSPQQPNSSNDYQPSPTATNSTSSVPPMTSTASALYARRAAKNPPFEAKIQHMSLKLAPLVQLTTGLVHPNFPRTLLAFWLLTEDQLDDLAHFYHQRTPCEWTQHYPCPVSWPPGLTLEEKRRKLGKFIGLRGCDTPIEQLVRDDVAKAMERSEEDIERDAAEVRRRGGTSSGDDMDEIRRKMGWY